MYFLNYKLVHNFNLSEVILGGGEVGEIINGRRIKLIKVDKNGEGRDSPKRDVGWKNRNN